ncbi:hypothetical protein [Trichococcus pasteurii]|uniref:Uncharacterized protein n=1 Tax=Trichococcus pasteurii TaxID=43064 RepID=A0A1W1ICV0_9LACT|nr:hypothetical protein [Trichococcus pasteurii]SFE37385.1 hypothetical protein SAMN04488086_10356 [Trichococcus pasteurii]SLM50852.1 Hypothetical protein TPAS_524 [Trichococcus pasteurii]SSB91733.1 Hypothetical protein TPAS_524 [Trichococcus pasteurii]
MKRKRRIEVLAEDLGEAYSIQIIDGVDCVYRKLNKFCDVEISGALSRKKVPEMMVCVWDISRGETYRSRSLEYFWFAGIDVLKKELPGIIEKYKDYKPEN